MSEKCDARQSNHEPGDPVSVDCEAKRITEPEAQLDTPKDQVDEMAPNGHHFANPNSGASPDTLEKSHDAKNSDYRQEPLESSNDRPSELDQKKFLSGAKRLFKQTDAGSEAVVLSPPGEGLWPEGLLKSPFKSRGRSAVQATTITKK